MSTAQSSKRRVDRRSSPPPPGEDLTPDPKQDGIEGHLTDDTSLRVEDAQHLRDELRQLLSRYDEGNDTRAYTDGMTAGCAACVDPGQTLRGLLDTIEHALEQADRSEVVDHE